MQLTPPLAFRNISTGVYRYPKKQAAQEASSAVKSFIQQNPKAYDQILFICFDDENYRIYQQLLA